MLADAWAILLPARRKEASICGIFSRVPHTCCSSEEEGLGSLTPEEVGSWASTPPKLCRRKSSYRPLYPPTTHTHTHCLKTSAHLLGLILLRVGLADL